jgi:trehalose 6-phosphate phosphatase
MRSEKLVAITTAPFIRSHLMADRYPPVVSDPVFFLDYDGTLAPIVPDPLAAFPHPDAPSLLEKIAERYPMWIVTGRYLKDLELFIDQNYPAIGLHGMQEGRIGGEVRDLIDDASREALDGMRERVPDVEGLYVEPKGPTFAVHYRHVEDESAALADLEAWVSTMPDRLEVVRGKKVYEIRPKGVNKGTAVLGLLDSVEGTPVYLGDDVTDEDAFRALERYEDSVTVRVGGGETCARYALRDPNDVVEYLSCYA